MEHSIGEDVRAVCAIPYRVDVVGPLSFVILVGGRKSSHHRGRPRRNDDTRLKLVTLVKEHVKERSHQATASVFAYSMPHYYSLYYFIASFIRFVMRTARIVLSCIRMNKNRRVHKQIIYGEIITHLVQHYIVGGGATVCILYTTLCAPHVNEK